MPLSRPLGGDKTGREGTSGSAADVEDCGVVDFPQIFLWTFQSALWHSREQYGVSVHLAQRLMLVSAEVFLQTVQARAMMDELRTEGRGFDRYLDVAAE
jgi:hypothetical protein